MLPPAPRAPGNRAHGRLRGRAGPSPARKPCPRAGSASQSRRRTSGWGSAARPSTSTGAGSPPRASTGRDRAPPARLVPDGPQRRWSMRSCGRGRCWRRRAGTTAHNHTNCVSDVLTASFIDVLTEHTSRTWCGVDAAGAKWESGGRRTGSRAGPGSGHRERRWPGDVPVIANPPKCPVIGHSEAPGSIRVCRGPTAMRDLGLDKVDSDPFRTAGDRPRSQPFCVVVPPAATLSRDRVGRRAGVTGAW